MVNDEMVEKALSSFNKTINEPIMVKCQRCDGRGYHHGFGEDGHDPDWCVECGGNQYDVAPGEEFRAMRAALEAALSAAPPVAVNRQDGNRTLPYDRDTLGRFVREAWVRWAETQPDPKPSWLVPYDQLSETDKEADRQIGEAVARWTLIGDAARYSKIKEHLDNIEATSDAISSPYRNSIIRKNALSAISALSAQVQDVARWQLVPTQPTEEMLDAYWGQTGESEAMRSRVHARAKILYHVMLAAAPAKQEVDRNEAN